MSGRTRLGVLGWPVGHSRSPQMQNAALRQAGLQDWRYQLLPVPPELLEGTVRALGDLGFRGANVTVPHKEAALALADRPTGGATAIGAANTLLFEPDGAIVADNTDAPALITALPFSPRGRTAQVLGAGGSARATQNLAELRSADSRRRLSPHNLMLTSDAYFPTQWSTQSFTVLYQSWEFWGFRTQWPSSGKYNIFEGMPSICRVVKSWKPSLTSKR